MRRPKWPAKWKKEQLTRGLRELLYKLRTEGTSPRDQAAAVFLGAFIGCTPLYGLHLALCILFARLFRVNPALAYLASHVSLPGLWPFLMMAELEIGRRLRGQSYLKIHFKDLRHLGWRQVGIDLTLGTLVLGGLIAAALGLFALWAARRRQMNPALAALREEAARRYLDTGLLHWEFVRGKLRYDPLYFNLLSRSFLPPKGLLLDLGCGRGIVFSLLLAASDLNRRGAYPAGWPPPPRRLALRGIEGRPKTADAARHALGDEARIETADLRRAELPTAQAILLLDVLHYLPAADQEALLARAAAALAPGGVLLIRDADAGAGWRFTAARLQERLSALLRRTCAPASTTVAPPNGRSCCAASAWTSKLSPWAWARPMRTCCWRRGRARRRQAEMSHASLDRLEHRPWPLPGARWAWRQSWLARCSPTGRWQPGRSNGSCPPRCECRNLTARRGSGWSPFAWRASCAVPCRTCRGSPPSRNCNVRLYVEHQGRPRGLVPEPGRHESARRLGGAAILSPALLQRADREPPGGGRHPLLSSPEGPGAGARSDLSPALRALRKPAGNARALAHRTLLPLRAGAGRNDLEKRRPPRPSAAASGGGNLFAKHLLLAARVVHRRSTGDRSISRGGSM